MSDRPCLNLSAIRSLSLIMAQLNSAGLQAIPGSSNLTYITNWDLTSSIFLSFQVIGSVGYGYAPPRTTGGQIFCMFFAFVGIPLLLTAALGIAYLMIGGAEHLRRCCIRDAGPKDAAKVHIIRTAIIFVSIFVMFILIPAGILTSLEKEWTYGDAVYFCLTSVISIGFADFIPGTDWSTDLRNIYRLGVGFWLIISLLLFAALWNTIGMAISSNREMKEPLPNDYNGMLPPDNIQDSTTTKMVPENTTTYIPRAPRSSQEQRSWGIFGGSTTPGTFNNPDPYTINRGPLYHVPVPRGEVTQVELRY